MSELARGRPREKKTYHNNKSKSIKFSSYTPKLLSSWKSLSDPIYITPRNYVCPIDPEIRRLCNISQWFESVMRVQQNMYEVCSWLNLYGTCLNTNCSLEFTFKINSSQKKSLIFYLYIDKWYIYDENQIIATRYHTNLLYNNKFMEALTYTTVDY